LIHHPKGGAAMEEYKGKREFTDLVAWITSKSESAHSHHKNSLKAAEL
jgi:hypothetical protein